MATRPEAGGRGALARRLLGAGALANQPPGHAASPWRVLGLFNLYRLVVAAACLLFFRASPLGFLHAAGWPATVSLGYLAAAAAIALGALARRDRYAPFLATGLIADLVALLAMFAGAGGVNSGLGVLFVLPLTMASLHLTPLRATGAAALLTLSLLATQAHGVALAHAPFSSLAGTGLLCLTFFVAAGLAAALGQRLRASEGQAVSLLSLSQLNRVMIEDMRAGVAVVDESNRVRDINRQALDLLGTAVFTPGMALEELSAGLAERFRQWCRSPDLRVGLLDGGDGRPQVRVHFIRVGAGASGATVVFLDDPERAHREAQQMKLAALGRLTANIAHEIRNPLGAIGHAAQLLLEEAPADSMLARLTTIINDNTRRLDKIVQDILQLNRSDRQARVDVDMAVWLPAFARLFEQVERLPEGALAVAVETDARLPFDEQHLNQVLWNLCSNAARYASGRHGCVRLAWRREAGAGARLDVRDDGPGIGADVAGNLFEPFFTTAAKGTGLGLYIARELCHANGAQLLHLPAETGAWFCIKPQGSGG